MIDVQKNIPLSKKTFYGIGGPADELYELDSMDGLGEVWAETIDLKLPKVILGKGANIVFADAGFRGRVFIPQFKAITWVDQDMGIVQVEAGANFQTFIEETNKAGYEDLCNLAGIPGNVGGFIRGNAGAYGLETADFIHSVEYLDEQGIIQTVSKNKADFVYRGSIFKQNPDLLVLRATFKLNQKAFPELALQQTKDLVKERWAKYPPGKSGGCVFKNPDPEAGLLAGKILDELGAKGERIGDIEVSQEHANFFVNKGKGTQADILAMIEKWRSIVKEKHDVDLEPEIFIVDERGQKTI